MKRKKKKLTPVNMGIEDYADIIIDSHFVFSDPMKAFSEGMDWEHISCRDCADFNQGFCEGFSLSGCEQIDTCIDEMVTNRKASCTVQSDGSGGVSVTITHESISGIVHPHMYGISGGVLEQMERKVIKGKYEVLGGCQCDWNNIPRVK